MKVVIFGAGTYGKRYIENCPADVEIIAVLDNNWKNLKGGVMGHCVNSPEIIRDGNFDKILITINPNNITGVFEIRDYILGQGVPYNKILLISDYEIPDEQYLPRIRFVKHLSYLLENYPSEASVCECGTAFGEFAAVINEHFPESKFHIFDTFEGYDNEDVRKEIKYGHTSEEYKVFTENYSKSSESLVELKLPFRDNAVIHKGIVPDTLKGIAPDEVFKFVHLDMNLYAPTIDALRFFANRVIKGGVILCHDCLQKTSGGVYIYGCADAVRQFHAENDSFVMLPIGDDLSLVLYKIN